MSQTQPWLNGVEFFTSDATKAVSYLTPAYWSRPEDWSKPWDGRVLPGVVTIAGNTVLLTGGASKAGSLNDVSVEPSV